MKKISFVWLLVLLANYGFTQQNKLDSIKVTIAKLPEDSVISLDDLKANQAQLIQSEKMASLGELTSGIAHEIQNPLNFVNNFSELSSELIGEMEEERAKKREAIDETLISEILGDIKQNLAKIKSHGKRTNAIVKRLLEHSRTSTGEKVPTDINALADEYLRLSYHGLRAKDKSFNAYFEIITDKNLPNIEVIPQDMGRVVLNLIKNAFWAVNVKGLKTRDNNYKPKVTVTIKTNGKYIEISVNHNGNGIPQENIDKVLYPFFTTNFTGQGTGLGLSLSYDIVKAHGEELRVKIEKI